MAAVLFSCTEFDDTAIWEELRSHEARIAKLETLCDRMNTNISSLQTIVLALQEKDFVTGVAPIMENGKEIGYTITFSKSGSITIYHGKNGTNGVNGTTPVIGVKKDTDGKYYWILNGEWIRNDAGEKIPTTGTDGTDGVNGFTPKLKIENGYWYISYDNGQSWDRLDKAVGDDGDAFLQSVTMDDKNVYIILADGTPIVIPIEMALSINFVMQEIDSLKVYDTTFDVRYTIAGATGTPEIETICETEWPVEIIPENETSGIISISIPRYAVNNKIAVFLSDSRSSLTKMLRISLPYIKFKDPETEKSCLWWADENGDGRITYAEAAQATNFDGIGFTGIYFDEFKYFTSLQTIDCFSGLKTLKEIHLPEQITNIPSSCFSSCFALEKVTLSSKIDTIGDCAFYGCRSLKEISLPNTVWSVGEYAFCGCSALERIEMPYSMSILGRSVFYNCSGLKEVIIPNGIQILEEMFYGCTSLEKVTIPSSVNKIMQRSFDGCTSIKEVVVDNVDSWLKINFYEYYDENGVGLTTPTAVYSNPLFVSRTQKPQLVTKTGQIISEIYVKGEDLLVGYQTYKAVKYGSLAGYQGKVTLDDDIRYIERGAFSGSGTQEITMPYQLDTIAASAFSYCDSIKVMKINSIKDWMEVKLGGSSAHPLSRSSSRCHTSICDLNGQPISIVEIPNVATEIPNYCFYGHQDMKSFYFQNYDGQNLKKINGYAFYRCTSLTSISIPKNVEEIGIAAFQNCAKLRTVYIACVNPPALDLFVFDGCHESLEIYVPKESLDAYKTAAGWSEYADKIYAR